MKPLVNLESEVFEKEPIMKLQFQLYIELQSLCVWNTSPGTWIYDCHVQCIPYTLFFFSFFAPVSFYRLSYTIYELIFTPTLFQNFNLSI